MDSKKEFAGQTVEREAITLPVEEVGHYLEGKTVVSVSAGRNDDPYRRVLPFRIESDRIVITAREANGLFTQVVLFAETGRNDYESCFVAAVAEHLEWRDMEK